MSQALRKLTGAINRSNCAVVFINQLREKIGVMFGNPETTTGGKALKFYASLRLDIRRIGPVKERETVIGNHVRVKVVKNKVAPPFRQAEFDIMFDEGISHTSLLVDLAAEANIIEKSGAWYSYGDQRIGQGRENAKLFLRDNPALMAEVEDKVKELLGMHAAGGRRRHAPRTTTSEPAGPHGARAGSPPPGHAAGRGGRGPVRRRARDAGAGGAGWRSAGRSTPSCRSGSRRAADAEAAFRTLLRALERRSFARADLGRRLIRKGHPRPAVEAALERAAGLGLLDDAAFARNYVQTRAARGRGPPGSRAICWPWASSGRTSIVRSPPSGPRAATGRPCRSALAAKRAAQLGDLPRQVKRRRVLAYLARRGFAGRDISDLVARR